MITDVSPCLLFSLILPIEEVVAPAKMMCGGLSDETRADEATQSICDRVKAAAEQKARMSFKEFKAVSYTKQVVAGMNHFIKVDVGDGGFVHIRVYEPLPCANQPIQLSKIQLSKSKEDKIECF